MPRPISARIHLSALRHNYAVAREHASPAKVWAVVKANAYGHGLEHALTALEDADGLALVEVDGALRLRELGWTKPLFLLEGFFHAADLPLIQQHRIDVAVHCSEQITLLEQASLSSEPIQVHLKVNGGMNRLGFRPEQVAAAYTRLSALVQVRVVNLMMHFANADDEFNSRLPVAEQCRQFELAQASLGDVTLGVSLSNSAVNLLHTSIHDGWARAGIMLYGGSPSKASADGFDLRPAMTLQSELIAVQEIKAGESIGYGSRFVADKPMRIGVVACGYADGYPRHAVDGTPLLINGVRAPLVGRVSMDMITVDITDINDARVGALVTLWGQGLPIDEVAHFCGTIGYELMCAVAPRVRLIVGE